MLKNTTDRQRLAEKGNFLFINGMYPQQLQLIKNHDNQISEILLEYFWSEFDFNVIFNLLG
jgi:hypothetical protein